MSRQQDDLSDFWNIEALLPQRKKKSIPPRVMRPSVEAVDVCVGTAEEPGGDLPIPSYVPRKKEILPERTYRCADGLLREVNIYPWRSETDAYARFQTDAGKLYRIVGKPCRSEPFFSFVPQYSQMSREQLNTYLWWREQVREGQTPAAEFSYLKLYLFELINLSDTLEPDEFFRALFRLWNGYREVYSQLDCMISEWLCDYCIIHEVRPPECVGTLLGAIEKSCSLREVLLPWDGDTGSEYRRALLTFCSGYDYKTGRYASGAFAEQLERHIPAAVDALLRDEDAKRCLSGPTEVEIEREAYSHAVCAASVKKRLNIRFLTLSRSYELRMRMTEIVKYAENRLRAANGIKSRLTVKELPDAVKAVLNRYFDTACPSVKKPRETASESEAYWKLYDTVSAPLSVDHAAQIESDSWRTTEKLVETFAVDVETTVSAEPTPQKEDVLTGVEQAYLRAVLAGDRRSAERVARDAGEPEDAVAERVNAFATERIGDVVLEPNADGAYVLIADYISEVKEWIQI